MPFLELSLNQEGGEILKTEKPLRVREFYALINYSLVSCSVVDRLLEVTM